MKFKNNSKFFNLAVAALFLASSAQGDVLFDSTSNKIFDFESINQNIIFNASFSTPNYPIELKDVILLWRRNVNESGFIRVYLLSDKNATPGDVIGELSVINSKELPVGEQFLAVPLKNNYFLNSKTRYWIKIQASDSPGALAYARQHKGHGVVDELYLNMYGLHKNSDTGPYLFRINGDRSK